MTGEDETSRLRALGHMSSAELYRLLERGLRRSDAAQMKRFDSRGTLVRVPEVVALRERLNNVCVDEDCGLSGGDAHRGDCEPCGCGLEHAALECQVAMAAGWTP